MRNLLFVVAFASAALPVASQVFQIPQPVEEITGLDLSPIANTLGEARVVGMGESTHGTHEFQTCALHALQYLVAHHGFNTVFIEDEYSRCAEINAYLCGDTDQPLLAEHLRNWPWRTEEANALFAWMRSYNRSHPDEPITLVGLDIQDAPHISEQLNVIREKNQLAPVPLPTSQAAETDKAWEAQQAAFSSPKQITRFAADQAQVAQSDSVHYQKLLLHLDWNQLMVERPKARVRDLAMANHVLDYLEEHPSARGMVIAHNVHLYKYIKVRKKPLKRRARMGGVLDRALGNGYVLIRQDFVKGCFNAYGLVDDALSSDSLGSYALEPQCLEAISSNGCAQVFPPEPHHLALVASHEFHPQNREKHPLWTEKYLKYHVFGAVFTYRRNRKGESMNFYYLVQDQAFDFLLIHPLSTPTNLLY